jgi:hypothetical protein
MSEGIGWLVCHWEAVEKRLYGLVGVPLGSRREAARLKGKSVYGLREFRADPPPPSSLREGTPPR